MFFFLLRYKILCKCWLLNPTKRPSVSELEKIIGKMLPNNEIERINKLNEESNESDRTDAVDNNEASTSTSNRQLQKNKFNATSILCSEPSDRPHGIQMLDQTNHFNQNDRIDKKESSV